tara:strand:- start:1249 stop:1563 length:315 start_codon:yes stop_codon:yes gene_type:complete
MKYINIKIIVLLSILISGLDLTLNYRRRFLYTLTNVVIDDKISNDDKLSIDDKLSNDDKLSIDDEMPNDEQTLKNIDSYPKVANCVYDTKNDKWVPFPFDITEV